ncbi:MAG: arginine deiminase-related protein [Candidatus Palauibacterales bacterium]|nr:arginine deiminase-related protein [Candidatus Palauibacterales bacterium]
MTGTLHAIVRPPSAALRDCALTHLAREPIDIALAQTQHAGYVTALEAAGARVLVLPSEPDLPDAVFVEDVAVVVEELAVMTIPGAPSRRPEVAGVAAALGRLRDLAWIEPPATLDGGDVLRVDRTFYVGRSSRTNEAGVSQLAERLAPVGYTVRSVEVSRCLHLKSGCTYLGNGTLLANRAWVDVTPFAGLDILDVDPTEPRGANTFRAADTLIMADNFPRTRARIEQRGFAVCAVALSELQKAEAGGSCMSLVFTA